MREQTLFDISGFPGEHVAQVWHEVGPLVELGLAYGASEFRPEDIRLQIENKRMQLWVAAEGIKLKGIAVTELITYPQSYVCQVILAAGTTVERWEHCLNLIEAWAFEIGVTDMRAYARPGWKPKAQQHGYEMQYCIYRKSLRINHENTSTH